MSIEKLCKDFHEIAGYQKKKELKKSEEKVNSFYKAIIKNKDFQLDHGSILKDNRKIEHTIKAIVGDLQKKGKKKKAKKFRELLKTTFNIEYEIKFRKSIDTNKRSKEEKIAIIKNLKHIPSTTKYEISKLSNDCRKEGLSNNLLKSVSKKIATLKKDDAHKISSFDEDKLLGVLIALKFIPNNELPHFIEGLKAKIFHDRAANKAFFKDLSSEKLSMFLIYHLLPEASKGSKQAKDVFKNEEHTRIFRENIKKVFLENKFNKLLLDLLGAGFIFSHSDQLGFGPGDDLFEKLMQTLATNKNPLDHIATLTAGVYLNQKNYHNNPVYFQPKDQLVANERVHISTDRLKKAAKSIQLTRKDLPKNATLKAWEQLTASLKSKFESNPNKARQSLALLDEKTNPSIINSALSEGLFKELLCQGGEISEAEAEWKATLAGILDKSSVEKRECFFTEQQETLIRVLTAIRNCPEGKKAAINTIYNLLESKYRYTSTTIPSKIVGTDEMAEINQKKEALQYVEDVFKKLSSKNGPKIDTFLSFVNAPENLDEASIMIGRIIKEHDCWDLDADPITLKREGAEQLLQIISEISITRMVDGFVRNFMEKHFSAEGSVMKEIVHGEKIKEAPHASRYLKNVIGSTVGVTNQISFDPNVLVAPGRLLETSRKKLLKIFFKHVTPASMIEKLQQYKMDDHVKQLAKKFLPQGECWHGDALTREGGLQLLKATGYLSK